jgi:NADH:ubiquinone oxidoreductase subunit 5 (subunit L)/multisubunit Na+/H+ antiporter MnhA subunit
MLMFVNWSIHNFPHVVIMSLSRLVCIVGQTSKKRIQYKIENAIQYYLDERYYISFYWGINSLYVSHFSILIDWYIYMSCPESSTSLPKSKIYFHRFMKTMFMFKCFIHFRDSTCTCTLEALPLWFVFMEICYDKKQLDQCVELCNVSLIEIWISLN